MKKFTQMLMVAIVATTGTTYAQSGQYVGDAIRFGNTNYGSSARFKGMGNAQIGVGGDMSSLGGNPAGLGLFTRSEFSFTPEFNAASAKSDYLGQKTSSSDNKLNINQAGVVWYNPTYKMQGQDTKKGVLSAVFGIGFNRTNDFTQDYTYKGTNTKTTMRDYFAELANQNMRDQNGTLYPNSLENMANQSFLINFNSPGYAGKFTSEPFFEEGNTQFQSRSTTGGTSELNFSGALNISNQLYIGASIGMVNARYFSSSEYVENGALNFYNDTQTPPDFAGEENYSFSYTTNQETKGSGVNGKLGIIFRPVGGFRIGATFQTPTWYYIEDFFSENLNTTLSGSKVSTGISPLNYNYTYRLRTPLKGSLGASYVIGGQGIISADVDFIDYASTRFSMDGGGAPDQDIINNNADIKKFYTSAINYRVGGEYKINNLSLRAGYGLNGSPLKDDDDKIFDTQFYTGGLGYRINEYYFDIAYQRVQSENRVSSYVLSAGDHPVATVKNGNNNVFLTFGIRF